MIGNLQEVIMKTCLIAASAFGGIFASDIIRLSAVILKKNMEADDMPEYIEREAAIRALLNDATEQVGYSREDAADCIRYMDAADVTSVWHGQWLPYHDSDFGWDEYGYRCSFCNYSVERDEFTFAENFCPYCGAKMDGE